jgi:1,4-dihydroxy-2-naphthoyl-CoA synthase
MLAMRIESHPLSIVCVMETLEVLRQDGIVTVTMNRPSKKNAARPDISSQSANSMPLRHLRKKDYVKTVDQD